MNPLKQDPLHSQPGMTSHNASLTYANCGSEQEAHLNHSLAADLATDTYRKQADLEAGQTPILPPTNTR
jgi:hypothetical protein